MSGTPTGAGSAVATPPSSPAPPTHTHTHSTSSPPPKLTVKFKKWTAVAVWKWITPNEETECGICRLPFDGCCPDCKFPGDDCALVSGQCRHSFHLHCIQKWLEAQQMQQQCPMCRQEWQFGE